MRHFSPLAASLHRGRTSLSFSSWSLPQMMSGTPTAARTDFTVAAAACGEASPKSGWVPWSFRQISSAPNSSTHFFAQSAGDFTASPSASISGFGQSSGTRSWISIATTGRFLVGPSYARNGRVFSPPTVTVDVRVPPCSLVAPMTTSFNAPAHFPLASSSIFMRSSSSESSQVFHRRPWRPLIRRAQSTAIAPSIHTRG